MLRLLERDHVYRGPGDLVVPDLVMTVVPFVATEERRQFTGDRWFLGEHDPRETLASVISPTDPSSIDRHPVHGNGHVTPER